jgi:hypothetical protein
MPAMILDRESATELIHRYGLNSQTLVVEVGSGSGQFLKTLQKHGIRVLGVEPDLNAMSQAWSAGVDTIGAEFGIGTAEYIRQHYGAVKLLIAQSVPAGSEAFTRLVAGSARCLHPDGVLAVQSAGVNAFVEVRPDSAVQHFARAA